MIYIFGVLIMLNLFLILYCLKTKQNKQPIYNINDLISGLNNTIDQEKIKERNRLAACCKELLELPIKEIKMGELKEWSKPSEEFTPEFFTYGKVGELKEISELEADIINISGISHAELCNRKCIDTAPEFWDEAQYKMGVDRADSKDFGVEYITECRSMASSKEFDYSEYLKYKSKDVFDIEYMGRFNNSKELDP